MNQFKLPWYLHRVPPTKDGKKKLNWSAIWTRLRKLIFKI